MEANLLCRSACSDCPNPLGVFFCFAVAIRPSCNRPRQPPFHVCRRDVAEVIHTFRRMDLFSHSLKQFRLDFTVTIAFRSLRVLLDSSPQEAPDDDSNGSKRGSPDHI